MEKKGESSTGKGKALTSSKEPKKFRPKVVAESPSRPPKKKTTVKSSPPPSKKPPAAEPSSPTPKKTKKASSSASSLQYDRVTEETGPIYMEGVEDGLESTRVRCDSSASCVPSSAPKDLLRDSSAFCILSARWKHKNRAASAPSLYITRW